MPKRTAEEKIEKYKKKLKKLENKTRKNKSRRVIQSDSEFSDNTQDVEVTAIQDGADDFFTHFDVSENEITEQNDVPTEISDLDPTFLEALGDDNEEEPEFGPAVHENLVKRWLPLIKKGLSKDLKEKLTKEYMIPENLKLLQAPLLNSEFSTTIAENVKSRDKKLKNNQQQLGTGLTAANRALHVLLSNGDKLEAIKHLSNCCRVLLDLHALETRWRRNLITLSLDKSFYQIVQDSKSDNTLFGTDLIEKIKHSKNSEKLGVQFKKALFPKNTSQPTGNRSRNQGNGYRPRLSSSRGGRGAPRKAPPAPPQPRRYHPLNLSSWGALPPLPPPYPGTSRARALAHR